MTFKATPVDLHFIRTDGREKEFKILENLYFFKDFKFLADDDVASIFAWDESLSKANRN